MTNAMVKDAKDIYIETGRLNRNIINKELSISWYKCKLQNLDPKRSFRCSGENAAIGFDPKFIAFINTIVPVHYDYILVNMSLQKCSSRMLLSKMEEMDTIDDLAIGTNGGYLTYKTQSNQLVSQDEHYLDCLCNYFSYGIVVSQGEKMVGVLMLLSTEKPNEYDIVRIREKLIQYNAKSEPTFPDVATSVPKTYVLNQLFAYPEPYMSEFGQLIEKCGKSTLPLLIQGSNGSGKSTLARLLSDKSGQTPYILCLNETPRIFQKQLLENGLSQFETVIIESIESADPEVINLLTVYTEEFALNKFREKHSNYNCSKLILTTAYDIELNEDKPYSRLLKKQLSKILERLKLNTVNLVNTKAFVESRDALVDACLKRNNIKATDAYKAKLNEYIIGHSFKSVQRMIEISMDDSQFTECSTLDTFPISITETIMNLEDYERVYILKIYDLLDKNMSATANMLNIGRSTLYRKLEKYHNDTH